ncbi:hypothetical protein AX16_003830 [Volvariella volvacea WC 439]|nr:hypothetical protein AX16_003830 [Volvariella volvacea WC 439]
MAESVTAFQLPTPPVIVHLPKEPQAIILDVSSGTIVGGTFLAAQNQSNHPITVRLPCIQGNRFQLTDALLYGLLILYDCETKKPIPPPASLLNKPIPALATYFTLARGTPADPFNSTLVPVECGFTEKAWRSHLRRLLIPGRKYEARWARPDILIWMRDSEDDDWLPLYEDFSAKGPNDEVWQEARQVESTLERLNDEKASEEEEQRAMEGANAKASVEFHTVLLTRDFSNFNLPATTPEEFLTVPCEGHIALDVEKSERPRFSLQVAMRSYELSVTKPRVNGEYDILITLTNLSDEPITIWFHQTALPYGTPSLTDAFLLREKTSQESIVINAPEPPKGGLLPLHLPDDDAGREFVDFIPGVPKTIIRPWRIEDLEQLTSETKGDGVFELEVKTECLSDFTMWQYGTRGEARSSNGLTEYWLNRAELDIELIGTGICEFKLAK